MDRLNNVFLIKNIKSTCLGKGELNMYIMQDVACNVCGISTLKEAKVHLNDSNLPSIIIVVSDSLGNKNAHSYKMPATNKSTTNFIINTKLADSLGVYMFENIYLRVRQDSILSYKVIPKY